MFTTENMLYPSFSFPKPIVDYFLTVVNGNIMEKLHMCCKYFYFKNNFTILDSLSILDSYEKKELISRRGIGFSSNESDLTFLKDNIWLTESFFFYDFPKPSDIISKIVRCEISQLTIGVNNVTMNEMKLLTISGNVKEFCVSKQIFDTAGKKVPPEDLISLVPKADYIFLNTYTFTEETLKNLIKLERPKKIRYLKWYRIEQEINVNLLCQFLEKHHKHGGLFFAWFNDDDYNERFGKEINKIMKKWEPKDRPKNFQKMHIPD